MAKRSKSPRRSKANKDHPIGAELSRLRSSYAETLKSYLPGWRGESFPRWRDYPRLPDDAPHDARDALAAVQFIDAALRPEATPDDVARLYAGVETIRMMAATRHFAAAQCDAQAARRAGGKATRKWTPEVAALVARLYDEVKSPRLKTDAAYNRVSARLKSEYGVSISPDYLRKRHARSVQR
jgi:hypothetical protein